MCVIMSGTVKPPLDWIAKAAKANPDGIGAAWIKGGMVEFEKDITVLQAQEIIQAIEGPYLLHFRMASIGGIQPELCHPFPVTAGVDTKLAGRTNKVLVHNGHWNDWNEWCFKLLAARPGLEMPRGEWSDTRAMAWLAHHCGEAVLDLIPDTNKVVTLTAGGLDYHGRGWVEKDGVWLSNDYFFDTGRVYGFGGLERKDAVSPAEYYEDWWKEDGKNYGGREFDKLPYLD